ncbi:hypothetical protein O6H91_02G058300 [Diphasiastrum complanatum]|uniref:Uncharacterized protein n=1 Tax=Diphasiastrum complanatum TaxID=34168 RepID=A0ACC2EGB5_DIPCM|nr:hypothetical protein O6H91_02G058300 [Diphasiastrum complanatum]
MDVDACLHHGKQMSSRAAPIWNTTGRGTAAGHALFRLYNGFAAAKNMGNHYSLQNRINMLRGLSFNHCSTPPGLLSKVQPKPTLKVPQFSRQISRERVPRSHQSRGKRKATIILKQLKEDMTNLELPPAPAKPPLDDKEKERLQRLFEWSGRGHKEEDLAPKVFRSSQGAKVQGSKEEKEHLLDLIAKEIEEREEFLKDMQKLGRTDAYQNQIRMEIQDRIKQMKKLDKLITQDENGQSFSQKGVKSA